MTYLELFPKNGIKFSVEKRNKSVNVFGKISDWEDYLKKL